MARVVVGAIGRVERPAARHELNELVFKSTELLDRAPHVGELGLQQVDDVGARCRAFVAKLGDPADLVEGEPSRLGVTDEREATKRLVVVIAIATRCPRRFTEESETLIEPNRPRMNVRVFRKLTDPHPLDNKPLDLLLQENVYPGLMRTGTRPRSRASGGWQQVVGPLGTAAAGFTTLCCLGVSAAVSLGTSLGATFLTRDSALRPLLAATLVVTVAASALTFWRHRGPVWPLAVSVAAAMMIYGAVYIGLGAGGMHDAMAGEAPADTGTGHRGLGNDRLALVWTGAALLIAAQLWDLRRARSSRCAPSTRRGRLMPNPDRTDRQRIADEAVGAAGIGGAIMLCCAGPALLSTGLLTVGAGVMFGAGAIGVIVVTALLGVVHRIRRLRFDTATPGPTPRNTFGPTATATRSSDDSAGSRERC